MAQTGVGTKGVVKAETAETIFTQKTFVRGKSFQNMREKEERSGEKLDRRYTPGLGVIQEH
ncbi:hypothetical protein CK934_04245 [Chitinophaga sp. MD30]|nr:hypothetical protein CK934_04245 [Chitinophaga sp. MD30]